MPVFHIRLAGDEFCFSAGHFLVFAEGQCERLHGHTYRVAAEVWGPLDGNYYVVDFLVARGALAKILRELDHRVLLAGDHEKVSVVSHGDETEVTFDGRRRWVFPHDDCLVLPIANTTTELLAQYVGERFMSALTGLTGRPPERLRVEIAESTGSSAICDLP